MSITGQYAGSPVFIPPEQITNFKYVKLVSDVWSFAASLYSLLTGKFPYRFGPQRDPIDIILNENPVPMRGPSVFPIAILDARVSGLSAPGQIPDATNPAPPY